MEHQGHLRLMGSHLFYFMPHPCLGQKERLQLPILGNSGLQGTHRYGVLVFWGWMFVPLSPAGF